MKKHYVVEFQESLGSTERDDDKEAQKHFAYARNNFQPLYYIKNYADDKKKIEMSFDLTKYQPQFSGVPVYGPGGTGDPVSPRAAAAPSTESDSSLPVKEKPHVFQTIFLDRDGSSEKWTQSEIDPGEVISVRWWKQQSHRWQHCTPLT